MSVEYSVFMFGSVLHHSHREQVTHALCPVESKLLGDVLKGEEGETGRHASRLVDPLHPHVPLLRLVVPRLANVSTGLGLKADVKQALAGVEFDDRAALVLSQRVP